MYTGQDIGTPGVSVKQAEMTRSGLYVVPTAVFGNVPAEFVRDQRLTGPRNVVQLSLDRHESSPRERSRIDRISLPTQTAARKRELLKDEAYRVQEVARR